MNTNEQKKLLIDDMHFLKPDQKQEALIADYSTHQYMVKFRRRFLISLVIALIVIIVEYIARRYTMETPIPGSIPGMLFFVSLLFVIYNIISYIYIRMKIKMDDFLNKYECMYGMVTEKYDGRHLSKKSGQPTDNYILFSNEEGHCTTALSVKSSQRFQSINIGDEILVLKCSPMGMAHYEFIQIK